MQASAAQVHVLEPFPVQVHMDAAPSGPRNRLTVLFRPVLALPHLLLVGGPTSAAMWWTWRAEADGRHDWGASGGVLGVVAVVCAIIAWFAIVFTGRHPEGLWSLAAFYLRWRARAVAYVALLRDEYPPFGDAAYPVSVEIARASEPRDRVSVGFRLVLVLPHLIVLWLLGFVWLVSAVIGWVVVLFTGRLPEPLYRFGAGMLRWHTRVDAYALLLVDEYPPFSLDV